MDDILKRDKNMKLPVQGELPGDTCGVYGPYEGWEENTYYVVDVSFSKNNPVFRAIFFTGFLNGPRKGDPGGYNRIMIVSYATYTILDAYYMRAIRRIMSDSEMQS